MNRLVESSAAETRLAAAREFLLAQESEVVVLAPTRPAADDFVRAAAAGGRGLFGVYRMTPGMLAAEMATPALAERGLAPVGRLGLEALAARGVHDCPSLAYFQPVAEMRGFARALASTLDELRLEGVRPEDLDASGDAGRDLARLLVAYESALEERSLADRRMVFELAGTRPSARSVVLLDVAPRN
ncbi:MAG: hypothetical protein ACRD96_09705, partial [Bryobacteraceae bacterium]